MRLKVQYFAAAAVILAVGGSSCKGRYADATPNGETIEVKVAQPASDGTELSGNGSVTTEVVSISQPEEKK